jgi:hypothetical protein
VLTPLSDYPLFRGDTWQSERCASWYDRACA